MSWTKSTEVDGSKTLVKNLKLRAGRYARLLLAAGERSADSASTGYARWVGAVACRWAARGASSRSLRRCGVPLALLWPLMMLWAVLLAAQPVEARPVRVRGGAKLLAQARFVDDSGILEVRGRLADDSGLPIRSAWLGLRTPTGLSVAEARGCPRVGGQLKQAADSMSLRTDVRGELCVRWEKAPSSGKIELRFDGDDYHGADHLDVTFDRARPQRLATTIRFDAVDYLDLEKERLLLGGRLVLALDDAYADLQGLPVALYDERDQKLADAQVAGDGKIRVELSPKILADPGDGSLTLKFPGNAQLEPATATRKVTRRATVKLKLLEPVEPTAAGEQAILVLRARTLRGAVAEGVVEAYSGAQSLGSAQLQDGRAELSLLIDNRAVGNVELAVRYHPGPPCYVPDAPLDVVVPVAPPSPLWRGLLLAVVLLAAAWVLFSWRRARTLPTFAQSQPLLAPGVHVIASRRGDPHYSGVVLDAHDGTPIAGASIVVRAPSLDDDGVLVAIESDARGQFAFELEQRPDGAEIIAEAQLHSEQKRALPAGGQLRIALLTRRRATLLRLVQWARVRGRPYDQQPDPTPADVRKAGRARPPVHDWAAEVENAAFGPSPVDATVEHHLRDIEPGPEQL